MKTAEEILKEKDQKMICIEPDGTVLESVQIMVKNKIGAILIRKNEVIEGIFTERDLLQNSANEDFDLRKVKIKEVMTTNLLFANYDAPLYQLMDIVLGKRCRHLLIVKEGKYIGLLSAGDLTRASLNEKSKENSLQIL